MISADDLPDPPDVDALLIGLAAAVDDLLNHSGKKYSFVALIVEIDPDISVAANLALDMFLDDQLAAVLARIKAAKMGAVRNCPAPVLISLLQEYVERISDRIEADVEPSGSLQ